jgi:hypothetical protein
MNVRLLVCLPLLAASASPLAVEEEIRFQGDAGGGFTMTFDQDSDLELVDQDMTAIVNGEEMDQPIPDVQVEISQRGRVVIRDEFIEAEEGRLTKVRRTFEEISQSRSQSVDGPMGSNSQDDDGSSELAGTAVVFTWNADEETWDVAFAEDEKADEELLEDLEFDVHFTDFLPSGPVSEGDSWEVPASALNFLNDPGGDLQIVWDSEKDQEKDDDDDMGQQFDENMEGTITCKLAAVTEEAGERVATIELVVETETSGSRDQDFDTPQVSGTSEEKIDITFELEGELRWNLDAHHAIGLTLEGPITYTVNTNQNGEGEMSVELEATQSFEGTSTFAVSVEALASAE